MKIYVAGASSEIERAEAMIVRLKAADIEVTSTWTENVRKAGHGSPADASHEQRRKWSEQDLQEVGQAHLFWFLLPRAGNITFGAWGELCFAYSRNKRLVISGSDQADRRSANNIFVGLGILFPDDEDALAAIVGGKRIGAFDIVARSF